MGGGMAEDKPLYLLAVLLVQTSRAWYSQLRDPARVQQVHKAEGAQRAEVNQLSRVVVITFFQAFWHQPVCASHEA